MKRISCTKKNVFISIIFISFLFVIPLISCTKDKAVTRNYPRLITLSTSQIGETQAVFNAEIFAADTAKIIEYGFTWNPYVTPYLDYHDKITVSDTLKEMKFSELIQSLQKDQTYHVRSYVKTRDLLIYGTEITFKTLK